MWFNCLARFHHERKFHRFVVCCFRPPDIRDRFPLLKNLIQYANECDDDYIRLQILRIIEALISHGVYLSPSSVTGRERNDDPFSASINHLSRSETTAANVHHPYKSPSRLSMLLDYAPIDSEISSESDRHWAWYNDAMNDSSIRSDSAHLGSPEKRSRDHDVVLSAKTLDELIEHLDTALAFLLTETIHSNRMKELQVQFLLLSLSNDHPASFLCLCRILYI